ncbi:MAG: hypothetical protein U0556_09645 [Dehalococcoidia bacterium]
MTIPEDAATNDRHLDQITARSRSPRNRAGPEGRRVAGKAERSGALPGLALTISLVA